jgi:hypothetical protein
MTKYEKEIGIPKPADVKRIDPPNNTKKNHHKKKYPPHWQLREGWIWPSKILRTSDEWRHERIGNVLYQSKDYLNSINFLNAGRLDEALAIYTKHHPETAEWPVRFIGIQPMKTKREVLT